MESGYLEPVSKGVKYQYMLDKGTALVLEGGGTRGFFSAGVLDAFIEARIMFPYIVGVSAGAANALSYISGQQGRSRIIAEKYVRLPKYLGLGNLLSQGSLFGFDFIFKTIPEEYLFWDKDVFDETPTDFFTGATDLSTGRTHWFGKDQVRPGFEVVRASCSIPFVSKRAEVLGMTLLDGGVSTPIPIEKSLSDGNRFHVIVLTRNAGYRKPALRSKLLLQAYYHRYPEFMNTMLRRHDEYNRQVDLCERLAAEGKAVIIRPQSITDMKSTSRDIPQILRLYDEGYSEGVKALSSFP
ncbi:MAG: patatin family protein [Coriobacteriia bacterium]|nr:patatin family protein [Coriobacteriia bacterium]